MASTVSECALIVAPLGRDANIAAAVLREANIESAICANIAALVSALEDGAGFAVITDDALRSADLNQLSQWLAAQPEWSDFPFVLLTERGGSIERNPAAARYLETLGNVTFVERPFHPTTLVSVARAALRARRRQYDARARLHALHESEEKFRSLADSMPTLCWMAAPDGDIFWYNKRWYEYTGTSPDEMKGWGWQSVHDPAVLPEVLVSWKASLETGEPFEMVFPLKSADGNFNQFLTRVAPIRDADNRITRWFGTNTDISTQKKSEDHLNFLMQEISHRSKNLLAVIQSMIRQMARDSTNVSEFSGRLGERLLGLASTHDQLVDNSWQGATLRRLIVNQLAPFMTEGRPIDLDGVEIQLKPKAAEALGLAFHELATNAAKYGALSRPDGIVQVHWGLSGGQDAEPMLRLSWRERGGPAAKPPKKKGFGTLVLTRVVPSTLSGAATLDYPREGVSWAIDCPAKNAVVT